MICSLICIRNYLLFRYPTRQSDVMCRHRIPWGLVQQQQQGEEKTRNFGTPFPPNGTAQEPLKEGRGLGWRGQTNDPELIDFFFDEDRPTPRVKVWPQGGAGRWRTSSSSVRTSGTATRDCFSPKSSSTCRRRRRLRNWEF